MNESVLEEDVRNPLKLAVSDKEDLSAVSCGLQQQQRQQLQPPRGGGRVVVKGQVISKMSPEESLSWLESTHGQIVTQKGIRMIRKDLKESFPCQ